MSNHWPSNSSCLVAFLGSKRLTPAREDEFVPSRYAEQSGETDMNWLKHAFDLDGPDEEIPPAERDLVERLSTEIVRRQLAVPALVFLEMSRPLNVLSAQALHFLAPMLGVLGGSSSPTDAAAAPPAHQLLAKFLERRDSIGYICDRIEALEKLRVEVPGTDRTE